MNYEQKYLKYKKKYLEMKAQVGGVIQQPVALQQVPIQQPVALQQAPIQQPVALQQIPVLNFKYSPTKELEQIPVLDFKYSSAKILEQIDISFKGHYYSTGGKDYLDCGMKTNKKSNFILRLKKGDITLSHKTKKGFTKVDKIFVPIFKDSKKSRHFDSEFEENDFKTVLKFKLHPNDPDTNRKCVYLEHNNKEFNLNYCLYFHTPDELSKLEEAIKNKIQNDIGKGLIKDDVLKKIDLLEDRQKKFLELLKIFNKY